MFCSGIFQRSWCAGDDPASPVAGNGWPTAGWMATNPGRRTHNRPRRGRILRKLPSRRAQRAVHPFLGGGVVQRILLAGGADVSLAAPARRLGDKLHCSPAVRTPLPDHVQLGHLNFPAATSLVPQRALAQGKSRSTPHRTMPPSMSSNSSDGSVGGMTRHGAGAGSSTRRWPIACASRPEEPTPSSGGDCRRWRSDTKPRAGRLLRCPGPPGIRRHRCASSRRPRPYPDRARLEGPLPPRSWRLELASNLTRSAALKPSVIVDTGRPLREPNNRSCRCRIRGPSTACAKRQS